ncbi:MAG: ammonia channel protein, partial [Bacillota bacterium]|nr:ammonia channel protein [Bacillota bacterium]
AFAALGTFLILNVMKLFIPLRTAESDEVIGLDLSLHGEEAYNGVGV